MIGERFFNLLFPPKCTLCGKVLEKQETLTVVFDDREADYDFTQLNELEPAYAMTVHKS